MPKRIGKHCLRPFLMVGSDNIFEQVDIQGVEGA